jgi:hypothetical protein
MIAAAICLRAKWLCESRMLTVRVVIWLACLWPGMRLFYRYSVPTIASMVGEAERESKRAAFLSTPSIFFSLNDKTLQANSKVLDVRRRERGTTRQWAHWTSSYGRTYEFHDSQTVCWLHYCCDCCCRPCSTTRCGRRMRDLSNTISRSPRRSVRHGMIEQHT